MAQDSKPFTAIIPTVQLRVRILRGNLRTFSEGGHWILHTPRIIEVDSLRGGGGSPRILDGTLCGLSASFCGHSRDIRCDSLCGCGHSRYTRQVARRMTHVAKLRSGHLSHGSLSAGLLWPPLPSSGKVSGSALTITSRKQGARTGFGA